MDKHNCHIHVGHAGNFGKRYVKNLEETVSRFRDAINNREVVTREDAMDKSD